MNLAEEPVEPEDPDEPEPQEPTNYGSVSVPGAFNSEAGCPGDWQPDCDAVQMTKKDGIWTLTVPALAAGTYEYKIATEKTWDENYGAGGVPNGPNITLTHTSDGGPVTFYFDPRTKNIRSTDDGPIITLPGSLQSELGCPGDWQPECLASMMFDQNSDGVFQFTTDDLPDRLVRGQGRAQPQLGRELRCGRCARRREHLVQRHARARSRPSATPSRRTSSP